MLNKIITGNLGNQLFQYAALRGFQSAFCPEEEINLCFAAENYRTGEVIQQANHLVHYNLNPHRVSARIKPRGIQRLIAGAVGAEIQLRQRGVSGIAERRAVQHQVELKRQPLLNRFGLYQIQDGYTAFRKSCMADSYFTGYFESERFFAPIKDALCREFTPIHPPRAENAAFYEAIRTTNAVCVAVRRGDFVGTEIDAYANICDPAYFLHAIELAKNRLEHPVFFLFSNDIEWARQNIPIEGTVYYEADGNANYESLRLMSACRHFIISNSSFHWWAQYLSKNENRLVVAPSIWRRNSPRPDIYQDFWITI